MSELEVRASAMVMGPRVLVGWGRTLEIASAPGLQRTGRGRLWV